MVKKRVLIGATELIQQVQAALSEQLGGDLNASAIKAIVESVLDVYCYGKPQGRWQMQTRDVLIGYGVSVEVVQEAELSLTNELLGMVQRGFGVVHPSRTYSYRWFNQVDLVIEEKLPALELIVETDDQFDAGYVPERLRRG